MPVVEAIRAYIDAHLEEPIPLAVLAAEAGLSPSHLQRTFKRAVGLSPRAYADARRLDRFKERVRSGDDVARATYAAGFGSSRALYAKAGDALGMTPGAYRRGGRGLEIDYAVAEGSLLGRVLVATTGRGVCAVYFGDDDGRLEAELAREFPRARLRRDDDALAADAHTVVRAIEGGRAAAPPPLDLRGTAWQVRVWQALRAIPRGETRTYGEIAAALGAPRSARAVGRACALNKVSGLVPCHRAVPAAGGLGGYRWGVERKARLLAGEGVGASGAAPQPPSAPSARSKRPGKRRRNGTIQGRSRGERASRSSPDVTSE